MTHTHCRRLTDAEVMRWKIKNVNCQSLCSMDPWELTDRLNSLGFRMLMIHATVYTGKLHAAKMSDCYWCEFYLGTDYPTFNFVRNNNEEESRNLLDQG